MSSVSNFQVCCFGCNVDAVRQKVEKEEEDSLKLAEKDDEPSFKPPLKRQDVYNLIKKERFLIISLVKNVELSMSYLLYLLHPSSIYYIACLIMFYMIATDSFAIPCAPSVSNRRTYIAVSIVSCFTNAAAISSKLTRSSSVMIYKCFCIFYDICASCYHAVKKASGYKKFEEPNEEGKRKNNDSKCFVA